ncbi:hypothetical protein ACFQGT_01845 [Natrialbaceae archaeon GCM10025810]|uniref:hypothetical protein n=1 Tax=Halovalidus salilacus TaxID=3075124 RepID=UPI003606A072
MTYRPVFDALISLAVFAVYVGLAIAVDARLVPPAVAAGALALIAFEAVAGRYHDRVEACWRRPAVQLATVGGALVLGLGGALTAPDAALSALGGTLATYLALLAAVQRGLVPPPRAWPP